MNSDVLEGSSGDAYKLKEKNSGGDDDVTVVPDSDNDEDNTPPKSKGSDKVKKELLQNDAKATPVMHMPKQGHSRASGLNVTSTPVLSNSRRVPLSSIDLDVTAIEEEDESEHLNYTFDRPSFPKKISTAVSAYHLESSSDEENKKENKIKPPANKKLFSGQAGKTVHPNEVIDLVQHLENIQLKEDAKKQFNFKTPESRKPPIPTKTINISDSSGSELDDYFSLTENKEKSIEIEEIPVPPQEKDKQPASSKFNFLKKLPVASLKAQFDAPVLTAEVAGFRSDVAKATQHLVSTLQNIPKKNAKADIPRGLGVDLYDHQSYGLEWLSWRESQYPGGGILADEMGLGKTIMIIALILRSKEEERLNPKPSSDVDGLWKMTSARSKLVPSSTTLIIVPPSVLPQWNLELRNKSPRLKVLMYHGPKRTESSAVLAQHDVVLSTYQTLGSEIQKDGDYTIRKSPMRRVLWKRIVIDEGHIIRNSTTNAAYAVCKLEATHRWVVTGTPVHNKPADMHSLVKFLRLTPFDDAKVWDFWIGLKSVSSQNLERLSIIAKSLILRRTKQEVMSLGGNVQKIPSKICEDVMVELSEEERKVYDHLMTYAENQFKLFLKNREQKERALQGAAYTYYAGKKTGNPHPAISNDVAFTHMLVLLLRLRQLCVLPLLSKQMLEEEDADLSLDDFDPMNQEDVISRRNPVFSENFKSAKLIQLFKDLEHLSNKCKSDGKRMDKVVIVSQWTTLLKSVEKGLAEEGYTFATISGEVKMEDRTEITARFNGESKRPQILLLSLSAGGVGLNLTGGNHMFFLDMHYNPQLELQAQDRIHRFGQTKDCFIRRYICQNSMEERVLELQKTKLQLAEGVLSASKAKSGAGITIGDMKKLFGV